MSKNSECPRWGLGPSCYEPSVIQGDRDNCRCLHPGLTFVGRGWGKAGTA